MIQGFNLIATYFVLEEIMCDECGFSIASHIITRDSINPNLWHISGHKYD